MLPRDAANQACRQSLLNIVAVWQAIKNQGLGAGLDVVLVPNVEVLLVKVVTWFAVS
jgi:hypothetical protein